MNHPRSCDARHSQFGVEKRTTQHEAQVTDLIAVTTTRRSLLHFEYFSIMCLTKSSLETSRLPFRVLAHLIIRLSLEAKQYKARGLLILASGGISLVSKQTQPFFQNPISNPHLQRRANDFLSHDSKLLVKLFLGGRK